MKKFFSLFLLFFSLLSNGQSWVKDLPFEPIPFSKGSGIITKVVKNPKNSFEMFVLVKHSGLWHTNNNGSSFTQISSPEIPLEIQNFDVFWQNKSVWVATEKGVFYFENKEWKNAGLPRIKDATDFLFLSENEILIASLGEPSKGVFKTSDKGKSWKQTFAQVGVCQIKQAPDDEKTLFISVWDFKDSTFEKVPFGKKSGIYKSTDSGQSWQILTGQNSGFLQHNVGKISLAVLSKNNLYALLDNRNKLFEKTPSNQIENLSAEDFLLLENEKIEEFIISHGLKNRFSAENLKEIIKEKHATPASLKEFLNAENEVVGAEIYHSQDGGSSWKKQNQTPLLNVFYNKGYEVISLEVNPKNENELYLSGVPILKSLDGGIHWKLLKNNDLDTKVYQFSLQNNQLLYATNKGLFQSLDLGKTWSKQEMPQSVNIESLAFSKENQTLLASVKNAGIWSLKNNSWQQISQENGNIALTSNGKYYISQGFGKVLSFKNNQLKSSQPPYNKDHKQRFSSETPLLISPQNPSILYTGSNILYQSLNEGELWNAISQDLTNGNKQGNKQSGTISAIAESPFQFGLLYSGSQDGMIYVSQNSGVSWQMVYSSFPQNNKVVNLVASMHQKNRVYAVLNSKNNQFLVFKSDDLGKSWNSLKSNLPEQTAYTLVEDPNQEHLLYLGTENGVFASFDGGERWHSFEKNLPKIAVNQIVINEKEGKIFVGTLNQGVFSADISSLKSLNAAAQDQPFYPLKETYSIAFSPKWGNQVNAWANVEKPIIYFDSFASQKGEITFKIMKDGVELHKETTQLQMGFNFIPYDLTIKEEARNAHEKKKLKALYKKASDGNYYLIKGTYQVIFEGEFFDEERILRVK